MASGRGRTRMMLTIAGLALLVAAGGVHAQSYHAHAAAMPRYAVVPQSRSIVPGRGAPVQVTQVDVGVVILEQVATTTMDISLQNPGGSRAEAELIVPVPDGAVVRSFTFSGAAAEATAEVLAKDVAKATYDSIVAKVRDPALLEFVGYNLIRSSVFPVEARGQQKVRLTYEHVLPTDGDRVDYVLLRSEAVDYTVPWTVTVSIKSSRPISTAYSPSHALEVRRTSTNEIAVKVAPQATTEPGAFRLSFLLERNGLTASLLAYPDPSIGGGYFLLLAGLPPETRKGDDEPAIKREVTLVLDRSGSMRGEKIEQVREAALQILAGLAEGEAFNIITYSTEVDFFSRQPLVKNTETIKAAEQYLAGITASGGTNLHDALLEALRQEPADGMLPLVLFLTDGLPTVGQTSEAAITQLATKANPHNRRVFTFGAGVDVNTPLLERIALDTRATSTFVLPKEDVEVKVAQVFKKLAGPVLADPLLAVSDSGDAAAQVRLSEVMPARLPDLFEGDQLVVLGRYRGNKPLEFTLSGNYLGRKQAFKFTMPLDKATTRNAFIPRLWASRKIAVLVDAIRALGAEPMTQVRATNTVTDPRLKELTEEIVRLSAEFGILTEYTAFLAREGTDLTQRDEVLAQATGNFNGRAVATRKGLASVNQSMNANLQRVQGQLNFRNGYWDENMNRVEVTTVQQINDRAFYRRGNRWIDGRLVNAKAALEPQTVIEFGSEEFKALVRRLASDNRQGTVSLEGEILLDIDGQAVLVKPPAAD